MFKFPADFLWGAATSSYQVEGANTNADWWEWERNTGLKEHSGLACRHYELFNQDFDLAKELNHNSHRLSIEWSRIQPKEGEFSDAEINHYKEVILALRQRNLEPILTLHHFTNPAWFAKLGGWQNKDSPAYFLRYVQRITESLCDKVRFWITINEPMVYVYHSYILGLWPPQEKSFCAANRVNKNLFLSHVKAYNCIRDIYKKNGLALPMISIAHNFQAFEPCISSPINKICASLRDKLYNFNFLNRLARFKALDFIGVNYYSRTLVEVRGLRLKNLLLDTCQKNHSPLKKNSLGWDIYPQGLYDFLLRLKKFNLPIMITENGICTDNDSERWDFISEHLKNISLAIKEGVNIIGYLYWSLLDNFEWDKGFRQRFGLIEVDYNTYERKIRESAKKFAFVAKEGLLY